MPTRNVNLTSLLDSFVEASVASGHCQNASEVIRERLRLLARREQGNALRLERLRNAVQAGEDDVARHGFHDLTASELDDHLTRLRNIPAKHDSAISR